MPAALESVPAELPGRRDLRRASSFAQDGVQALIGRLLLAASLATALLFAWRTMAPAFNSGELASDTRGHLSWMVRFRDPEAFRGDVIADYFQSLAPPAYKAVYWALSWVTRPLQANKVVAIVLGLSTALPRPQGVAAMPSPAAGQVRI